MKTQGRALRSFVVILCFGLAISAATAASAADYFVACREYSDTWYGVSGDAYTYDSVPASGSFHVNSLWCYHT